MRAVLKLESIGDSLIALNNRFNAGWNAKDAPMTFGAAIVMGRMRGRVAAYAECPPRRPWVARIVGSDPRFKYQREFIKGTKDYSEASGTGNRGVYYWFTLENGIYEVHSHASWKHQRRYFVRVIDSEITEIKKEEVDECLNLKKESASTCSQPPGNESHGRSTPSQESMSVSVEEKIPPY